MTRLVTIGCGLGLVLALAPTARAQPAESAVLFKEAQGLMAQGKYAEACDAFDASQRLDPTVSTMLNQANCREHNGQLATAWGLFLVTERQTRTATDDQGRQLHKVAVDHATKLEPRLSTLTVRIPDDVRIGGLEILRGTEPIDPALWNKAVPVDGGTYRVVARAPGNAEWTTTVTIAAERDAKSLDIPRLEAAELDHPDVPPHPAPQPVFTRAPTPDHTALGPSSTAGPSHVPIYLGVAAIAALGGGLAFDLAGSSTFDTVATAPDHDTQLSRWHTANRERYAAEALAVTGVATAGVAVWLYVRDRRHSHPEHGPALAPVVAPDHVGIQLAGGF